MLFARPGVGSERVATTDRDRNHHHLEYEFLAFDPAVSSDYEVVMVPYVVVPPESKDVGEPGGGGAGAMLHSEWPPSPWILTVFSSATGLWEERSFLRRGEPAGTVADLRPNWWRNWREDGRAEYWRGMLYVHCETNFVMRISLSDSTYRVIKPPRCFGDHQEFVIGRSKKGIYSAFLDDKYRLWIWILDESCDDQIEWKLMHDSGRGIAFPSPSLGRGPWILYDLGSEDQDDEDEAQAQLDQHQDDQNEAQLDQEFEWNSDDDNDSNIILPTDDVTEERRRFVQVMAFHPYKEIVFFHVSSTRVMAYHLSSSKVQDLGALLPVTFMSWQRHEYIRNYFPYTPCWMGELPEEEFE
ncbi:hypothetical protein BDA96_01G186100 [Sorghum bicolor]|uniref:F-box associated domain-containing protein n=2 Tax=Sorghum bicolor TaxID=4558 RepID=A0A921S186_SORBI|nr:uncharacterized protein LOC8062997 [Sorghum bicolor]KAG0548662.1 hypothetical protein BDA96_01G186100 [Sorghum bicolor]OQU91422.1 hypothetical protein SORBI_3001G177600 [Sorghum bicolor]|eukprot:XP_002466866.2 uncharacterized protein LOC8062997 [Sorghum bicolor]